MPRPAGFGSAGVSGSCAVAAIAIETRVSPNSAIFQLRIFIMTLGHHDHIAGLQQNVVFWLFSGDDFLVIEGELDLLPGFLA